MIDAKTMQGYIRDANPIPQLDDLEADELDRFVTAAHTRRAEIVQASKSEPRRPIPTGRVAPSRPVRAWAFAAAFIVVVAFFGIAALVVSGGEDTVTDRPPPSTTVTDPDSIRPEDVIGSGREDVALPTGGTPLPDFAGAVAGDDGTGPLPLGTVDEPPANHRLDFLFEFCRPDCFRDAHFMDPEDPRVGSGIWTAGLPFHVRHGFINSEEEPLGEGFDVVLYVTQMDWGDAAGGLVELGPTHRYTSDYVVRGMSDQCGPGYETQTERESCEWFVHDFPEGLPEGRFGMWVVWEAPCRAWLDLGLTRTCDDPNQVVSLFSSGFDAPFGSFEPGFHEWNDAQLSPEEISELAGVFPEPFDMSPPLDPAEIDAGDVAPSSDATPLSDDHTAVDIGTPRLPVGERTDLPNNARLDFLATLCWGDCFRDAHVADPADDQLGFGTWVADVPFHVRHGFVNDEEVPLSDDFDVVVHVIRREGPELDAGLYEMGHTHRFSSDYVLRDATTKCGPGYWDQTEPQTCEWFVHDFPEGLPQGRYDIWAEWYAPCSAWLDLGVVDACADPSEVTSRFASSVNMPFDRGVAVDSLGSEPITRGAVPD